MGNKMITRRRPAIDERYTRPQGLYPCRDVDHRKLRRLILDSKLAPCYPGAEEADKDLEECPICYLQYPSLNRSKCCAKGVCTECFLQMKPPHATRPTQCPFCKTPCYAVDYRGAKTLEEKGMEQAEEQKVIEAKIRMRQQELQDDEERQKRRIIEGPSPTPRAPPSAVAPVDDDWRSTWGTHPQHSALDERNTAGMDPYALWVDGDYQRAGGFDITAPVQQQQSTVSVSANVMSQQQTQTHLSTPDRRRENLDLDLEDLMIMEAIWLSIQDEQGAQQHRSSSGHHPGQRTTNRRRSESLTEISLDSESDDDAVNRLLPPLLHSVPESEPLPAIRVGELSNEATAESAGSVASDVTSGESSEGSVKLSFEEQMVMAVALSITDAPTRVRSGPLMGH